MMNQILFDQLPEVIKQKMVSEKYVKFVGYTENAAGKNYFILENHELTSYLHLKNEKEDRAFLVMRVPFIWLRVAADQIEGVADYLEEIANYAKMEKDDE